jgi:hypothetical protein
MCWNLNLPSHAHSHAFANKLVNKGEGQFPKPCPQLTMMITCSRLNSVYTLRKAGGTTMGTPTDTLVNTVLLILSRRYPLLALNSGSNATDLHTSAIAEEVYTHNSAGVSRSH